MYNRVEFIISNIEGITMPAISKVGLTGRRSNVSTVASQLTSDSGVVANEGVQILVSSANSEPIYVGYSSAITCDEADSTDGFPLIAGSSLFLPCRHASEIWVKAPTQANLVLWFITQ